MRISDWSSDVCSSELKPDEITELQWWWQFTRRRHDYRELWEKWSLINNRRIMEKREEYEALSQGAGIEIFLDRAPTDDPDRLRVGYQMSSLLNPAKDFSDWALMEMRFPTNSWREPYEHDMRKVLPPEFSERLNAVRKRAAALQEKAGLRDYRFDLSMPLEPQFTKARRDLLALPTA